MRWIVNENVSGTVIRLLRERGHDVLSVKESLRGADDADILSRAQVERRIVVTHDKDFGELAYRCELPAGSGVVLFRLSGADRESDIRRILEVLDCGVGWTGHFAVVTDDRVRIRPLPGISNDTSGRES
jgi:predicted nuclease of predicted toxin-antitoxin system